MYAGLAQASTPAPDAGPLTTWMRAFLSTAQGQAIQQDVSGAFAPLVQSTGQQAATNWFQQHQTQLLIGGAAALFLIVTLSRKR